MGSYPCRNLSRELSKVEAIVLSLSLFGRDYTRERQETCSSLPSLEDRGEDLVDDSSIPFFFEKRCFCPCDEEKYNIKRQLKDRFEEMVGLFSRLVNENGEVTIETGRRREAREREREREEGGEEEKGWAGWVV